MSHRLPAEAALDPHRPLPVKEAIIGGGVGETEAGAGTEEPTIEVSTR